MSSGTILFRVDVDQRIGIGHARRCRTLAKRFRMQGMEIVFVTRGLDLESMVPWDFGGAVYRISDSPASGGRDEPPDEEFDAKATIEIAHGLAERPEWVVVDSYELGKTWESIVRRAQHKVLCFDDMRTAQHSADIVVSDSGFPFAPTTYAEPPEPTVLNGPEFALIDPDFETEYRAMRREQRTRVLVTYGGSDPTCETLKALRVLRAYFHKSNKLPCVEGVDVIIGPGNPHRASILEWCRGEAWASPHLSLPTLAPLMRTARMVMCAGGNSMVEAIAMRIPSVVTIVAENQRKLALYLSGRDLAHLLGVTAPTTEEAIEGGIDFVFTNYVQIEKSLRDTNPFDFLGASRIASQVMKRLGNDGVGRTEVIL